MYVNDQRDEDATDESGILRLLRREEPTENMSIAVGLLDRIEQARWMGEVLDRAVEEALNLKPAQVNALKVIAGGPCTLETLSIRLGFIDEAAAPIVDSLIERGFVLAAPTGLFHATEAGLATVDRAEAIRYRSADLASSQLGAEQLEELVSGIDARVSSERRLRRA